MDAGEVVGGSKGEGGGHGDERVDGRKRREDGAAGGERGVESGDDPAVRGDEGGAVRRGGDSHSGGSGATGEGKEGGWAQGQGGEGGRRGDGCEESSVERKVTSLGEESG